MRYEKEKSFSLERRLSTWSNNEIKFNKNGQQSKNSGATDSEIIDALLHSFPEFRKE